MLHQWNLNILAILIKSFDIADPWKWLLMFSVFVSVCYGKSFQLSPTLCEPMDCGPPGSSVQGILQARILEWLPCLSPWDIPSPGIKSASPALAGGFFTTSTTWEYSLIEREILLIFLIDYKTYFENCVT